MLYYKKLFLLRLLPFWALFFFTCISCEKESISTKEEELVRILMQNKWIIKDVSFTEGQDYHAWLDIEHTALYFSSEESGVRYWVQKDYDTDLGNTTTKDYTFYTYTVKGNDIVLTFENKGTLKLTYQKNFLKDADGIIYTPQSLSSGDYEWLNSIKPAEGFCGKDLKYRFDKRTNKLEISGTGAMYDYTSNSRPWKDFAISEIKIHEGCTYIGVNAFINMKSLTTIHYLPESVKEIGDGAFANTLITSIDLPDDIERIGNAAFQSCTYLKNVYLDNCRKLEEIGESAFEGCPLKYTYFEMPENVRIVGRMAFLNSIFSKSFTLNEKIEEIGSWAFTQCDAGTLRIPNSMKKIASCAFTGSISKIYIGTGLQELGNTAFCVNSTGTMYVNLGNPLSVSGDIIDHASGWTLYVPKGSKTAYAKATGWKNFRSIVEDSSLESGNGIPEDDTPESYTGTIGGHEYIDLGLSVKWATCNVGATSPSDYGDYFVYGRKDASDGLPPYALCDAGSEMNNGEIKSICGTEYDMARSSWGTLWRLPSKNEMLELQGNCTFKQTKLNGISGCMVTSKINNQSIFFPYGGHFHCFYECNGFDFEQDYLGTSGEYWCGEFVFLDEDLGWTTNYGIFPFVGNFYKSDPVEIYYSKELRYLIYSHVYKLNVRAVTDK